MSEYFTEEKKEKVKNFKKSDQKQRERKEKQQDHAVIQLTKNSDVFRGGSEMEIQPQKAVIEFTPSDGSLFSPKLLRKGIKGLPFQRAAAVSVISQESPSQESPFSHLSATMAQAALLMEELDLSLERLEARARVWQSKLSGDTDNPEALYQSLTPNQKDLSGNNWALTVETANASSDLKAKDETSQTMYSRIKLELITGGSHGTAVNGLIAAAQEAESKLSKIKGMTNYEFIFPGSVREDIRSNIESMKARKIRQLSALLAVIDTSSTAELAQKAELQAKISQLNSQKLKIDLQLQELTQLIAVAASQPQPQEQLDATALISAQYKEKITGHTRSIEALGNEIDRHKAMPSPDYTKIDLLLEQCLSLRKEIQQLKAQRENDLLKLRPDYEKQAELLSRKQACIQERAEVLTSLSACRNALESIELFTGQKNNFQQCLAALETDTECLADYQDKPFKILAKISTGMDFSNYDWGLQITMGIPLSLIDVVSKAIASGLKGDLGVPSPKMSAERKYYEGNIRVTETYDGNDILNKAGIPPLTLPDPVMPYIRGLAHVINAYVRGIDNPKDQGPKHPMILVNKNPLNLIVNSIPQLAPADKKAILFACADLVCANSENLYFNWEGASLNLSIWRNHLKADPPIDLVPVYDGAFRSGQIGQISTLNAGRELTGVYEFRDIGGIKLSDLKNVFTAIANRID